MLYQNADSGETVLVVIALVALAVFILMLFAVLAIVRSEGKTKDEAGKEHKTRLTAGGLARHFPQDKPKRELTPRQRQIVESLKTFNWWACCIIAAIVAFLGIDRLQENLLPLFRIVRYYYWFAPILAILSPACIALAWLRLTGVPWRKAIRLFLVVPVGAFVIWFVFNVLPYTIAS